MPTHSSDAACSSRYDRRTREKVGEHQYRITVEIEAWCDSDEEAETVAARLADAADAIPTVGST